MLDILLVIPIHVHALVCMFVCICVQAHNCLPLCTSVTYILQQSLQKHCWATTLIIKRCKSPFRIQNKLYWNRPGSGFFPLPGSEAKFVMENISKYSYSKRRVLKALKHHLPTLPFYLPLIKLSASFSVSHSSFTFFPSCFAGMRYFCLYM